MGVGLAQSGSAFGRPADTAMERGEDPYEPPPSYTAGVPIPGRRQWMPDERRAELAWSAGGASSFHHPGSVELACSASPAAGTGGWHGSDWHEPELARDLQRFQIDDIFECEEVSELMPGPTLAELNAGDDLHELHLEQQGAAGAPPLASAAVKSELPDWPAVASGGQEIHHHRPPPGRRGTLQALLTAGSWAPRGCSAGLAGRLSSSVPCGELQRPPSAGFMRRDEARGSASSLSGSVLSPGSYDSYADDGIDSHDDRDSDSDSDAGSHMGDAESPGSSLGRKERYFWQYNVQAKGPKGARLQLSPDMADPYHVRQAVDPVFSSNFQMEGIKHSGKARRGDGNDLTPSPRKLLHIRGDLEKLNRKIADMPPISELPFSVRPKSRKEKNMLASRVCRLKKKAQHEANKIQLSGLNDEHRRLSAALREMGHLLRARVIPGVSHVRPEEAGSLIEKLYRQATKGSVAGDLQEYVKHILVNCETGRSMSGESFFSHGEPG